MRKGTRARFPEGWLCENCRFFEPRQIKVGAEDMPDNVAVWEGYCHRYPPVLMEGDDENFPGSRVHSALRRVHGTLACGEFVRWREESGDGEG